MRLNGTYFDRLLISVLPYTLIISIILHFVKRSTFQGDIIAFAVCTLFLWGIDSIIIYFKRLTTLRIEDKIYLGTNELSPKDIVEIIPVTDSRRRWEFKTIQFIINKDGKEQILNIMEKPMTIIDWFTNKGSKTLTPLFDSYPELKRKLRPPQQY